MGSAHDTPAEDLFGLYRFDRQLHYPPIGTSIRAQRPVENFIAPYVAATDLLSSANHLIVVAERVKVATSL